MSEAPNQIDGAKVIEWAWSGEKPFGTLYYEGSDDVAANIFGLAICSYGKDREFYRFSCDENWEAEQDSTYHSIEEAKNYLPDQYRNVSANWIKKN